MAMLEGYGAEAFTADLFGLLRANYAAAVLPFSERRAAGVDWLHTGMRDSELMFVQNRARLAYSFRPWSPLAVGVGVNYRTQSAALDGAALGEGAGWSTDLGILWRLPGDGSLSVGGSVRNWGSSTSGGVWRPGAWVRVEDGASQRLAPRAATWGIAYARAGRTAAVEWRDGLHIGVEAAARRPFVLRSGIVIPVGAGVAPTLSVGATATWRWGHVDYALVKAPGLPFTSYVGLYAGVSYLVPPVVIERVMVSDLYVALQDYYARPSAADRPAPYADPNALTTRPERLGALWLRNTGDEAVRVRARVWIEGFTGRRGTEVVDGVEIGPGERLRVPMQKLLLNDRAVALTADSPVEVRVEVADVRNEARRRAMATTTALLYGRNRMRLDDIGKLAVFITPADPSVRDFATHALRPSEAQVARGYLPRDLHRALILFSALREVAYGRDPNLPRGSGTIDAIRYPAELLDALRSAGAAGGSEPRIPVGDCDDSSALVAALLESAGIHTAIVQTPGHVLIAFDPGGITVDEAQATGWDAYSVSIDGQAWVPVETTLLSMGFARAWEEGLRQVRAGVVDSVTTRAAWERYGALSPRTRRAAPSVPWSVLEARVADTMQDAWFVVATRAFRTQ
jgi:hypothetical protein